MALTAKHIRILHVAKRQLGLSDDTYRDALRLHGRVESSIQLDLAGFKAVMTYFEGCGFVSTANRRNYGARKGMATAAQIGLIRALWAEWTNGTGTDKSLAAFLQRHYGVSHARFLDRAAVGKAITGLKHMVARKTATAGMTG